MIRVDRVVPKQFRCTAEQIQPLATGRGACFATDMIVVEGRKVGLMYREPPDNRYDSGWQFLCGAESQEYLDEKNNLGLYDVNTIANYDADVIPLLDSSTGSAFERDPVSGNFVQSDFTPGD